MIALVLATILAAPQQAKPDLPMEQTKKNIKVLQGVPSSQLIPIMTVMANSLGVTCAYCHESAWESDAKPPKEAARRMIRMTRAINDVHYAGKVAVSCQTCHHGSVTTSDVPPVENSGWNRVSMTPPLQPALPAADELFAKYVSAWGTSDALARVQERVSRGVVTGRSGRGDARSAPFEVRQTRPSTFTMNTELSYPPEADREIGYQFFNQLGIRKRYASVKTIGAGEVRGRAAYIVEAMPDDAPLPERLYFDAATGVLLRRHRERPTIVGVLPEEYDFDDYRTVDGVLIPFVVQWSRGDYQVTHRIADVKQTLTPAAGGASSK
ncbi:MAG TPA: photosynthetic reaction center cytochrome c subunit family protein [Thermoanaerobaculia bacterium]|nr:photosynthetic reaction center cytochrome c subunit family protein [Thermoanaerobaculia bacterium]